MNTIEIIEYTPDLQPDFERINKQWVEQFFSLEEFDRNQLENPKEYILDKGGAILFAKEGKRILGTVGLVKAGDGAFEMIKMGVSPEARGRGIGRLLGMAILQKARALGGRKVVLYSSSKLEAALALYRKIGFKDIPMGCGQYGRCNVKMEIDL
ncbi:GNAT family N-acetyltransferase [Mariniradius sediminis]|uniref:GNAT family N-acetyltransferase n=1 Tax=Mariniradius sediminis TaxID=2909237 RepID=A0ABS9BQS8_9BACT|nr:GNAT family N-acetyltransferase [Mariniradius sediminis]MCF1749847.1 GNAT family N-acetyltransferase [Mariniradius sediminis]